MRACNNLPQPPPYIFGFGGLRKIVTCSHSSSQCLLVSTVFGTVSSLHPTSFLMIFTLVVLYMSLPQYIPNCLLVSTVFGTVSSLHPTSFLMIFTLVIYMCRRSGRVAGYRIASKCFYAFLFRRPRGEKYRNNCVWPWGSSTIDCKHSGLPPQG